MNKYICLVIFEFCSFACLYAKDNSAIYESISYMSSERDGYYMISNYSFDHRLLCISKCNQDSSCLSTKYLNGLQKPEQNCFIYSELKCPLLTGPPTIKTELFVKTVYKYTESCKMYNCNENIGFYKAQNDQIRFCDNSQECYSTRNCTIVPKSCKEIKDKLNISASGIYYISNNVGLIEVYCEMVIDGGGYTFLPWYSLEKNISMLEDIYTDKTKVLFRLIDRNDSTIQPYIITNQWPKYSNITISVQINGTNYGIAGTPLNSYLSSYIYIGFLPAQYLNYTGAYFGFQANGIITNTSNCDGHTNFYFALYENLYPNPAKLGVSSFVCPMCAQSIINKWIPSAINHPNKTYMPVNYFYFMEVNMGGCDDYQQSNFLNYLGTAAGFI